MSHENKPNVNQSFEMIRQYIKSAATPTCEEIDTPTHYELTTVGTDGQKHLFGYVVAHEHVITIGFNTQISDKDKRQLFSENLLKKMNDNGRFEMRDAHVADFRHDIQDACEKLLYFYNEKNWITNS